ncbi:Aste57867_25392 [Aphanomyces stellatus]|uniref:Aste57867_25392 protein n=1 Tax=Aphanomyces stellatus TaxID=120398 RepID=A0A485LUD2_9STRA|nr:hypothetical protein As57867_025313 [Aphanomyces stellatus]VFU02016.1 Aste57867_25392 [Aphanomyces stellatus]
MSPTTTHLKEGKANSLVFAGVNFNIYKVRIQAKLRGKGLWKVVSGEDTRDDDADDDDEFDSKEDKAFDILVNSLDDDNLAYVSHVTTSKEVWDLLVTRYEARTYADVSHVIHELHTKVYAPGSSMQKHVTDMRGLQQKLLFMGSRVDDDMLGRILLTSVKEAFPTPVEVLRSREPSLTLTQITNRLLAKEDEMKSGTTTKRKADDDQLLYTGKPGKSRPFKKQVVKDKCHYCHKIGHHAFECRFKKRDLAKGITRKCMPTTNDEEHINILQHDYNDDEGFISDHIGACTADVTGNKALFTKLARTQQSTLQLADNSTVQSVHLGLLSIQVDKGHYLDRPNAKFVPNLKNNLIALRLFHKDGFEIAKLDLDAAILIRDTCVLRCLVRQSTLKLVQWQLRLAHLSFGAIKQAACDGVMEGLYLSKSDLAPDYNCEVCEVAKARRMSYKNTKPYRAQVPLERVHIDKGGPISPPNIRGIEQLYTNQCSPEENCVVEKSNYTVMNKVRCILQASGMDNQYWGEALSYVVYTEKRSPAKALGGKTPFEAKAHH